MKGHSYRLSKPTLAIVFSDGEKIAATIPRGGTVRVAENKLNGSRLVEVIWEGKSAMMFRQDLRERGELVQSVNA